LTSDLPQSFVFGASWSEAKCDQLNQRISRMCCEGLIAAILKRWQIPDRRGIHGSPDGKRIA
jgi:hypothetical protein